MTKGSFSSYFLRETIGVNLFTTLVPSFMQIIVKIRHFCDRKSLPVNFVGEVR